MKKYYYLDCGAKPFAILHIFDKPLQKIPKNWLAMTDEEYQRHVAFMNHKAYELDAFID